MARRVSSPAFVGRSEELAALSAGLEHAAQRQPAVFLIGGEAGVGKSRLVGELAAVARDAGAVVVVGNCVALSDGDVPLLPVTEALRQLAESEDEGVRRSLAEIPAELGALLRGWSGGPAADRPASPGAMFEHVLALLRRVSLATPLVVVIEDVHWADRSTLDLLAFVVRNLRDARLVIAATFRADEVERSGLRAWLADAARTPGAERLAVERFSRPSTAELLKGILGAAPEAELMERIFVRSEGNAFMAEELLAAAQEGKPETVPETLRDTLLARLDELGSDARRVVGIAAAAGGGVRHPVLEAAAGLTGAGLDRALDEAIRGSVLVVGRESDRCDFRHALLREVAYSELLPAGRARIHAALADAIEQDADPAGGAAVAAAEVAHHRRRSGDLQAAFAASVRAGVEAECIHAPAEALGHYERALADWDRVEDAEASAGLDRAELAARAAAAAEVSGVPERAVELVEQAIALVEEPVRAGLLHERRAWYLDRAGHRAESRAALEQATRLVPPDPPSVARAHVLASSAYGMTRDLKREDARARAEEALAVARRVGAEREEGMALRALATVHFADGDLEPAIDCLRRSLDIALRLGADADAAAASINLSDTLIAAGHVREGVEVASAGVERCRAAGLQVAYGGIAVCNAALGLMHLGDWDEVARMTGEALTGPVAGLAAAGLHQVAAQLAARRGDLDAAQEHVERAARQLPGGDLPLDWRWDVGCQLAELAVLQGDLDTAAAVLVDPLAEVVGSDEPVYLLRLSAATVAVCADRAELGAGDDAARARQVTEHAARAAVAPGVEGRALLALMAAECARADGVSQPGAWRAAVDACDRWGDVYRSAYLRRRLAEALLHGRAPRAEAAVPLREAYETARRLGAQPLERDVLALARRARIDLSAPQEPPVRSTGEHGLTAREQEVLELLAAGRTNRQIAETLFISIKTAGVHVSSILRKLDVSTRAEAGAVAHRTGLVELPPLERAGGS